MTDAGIKPRLVIIVFILACASVVLSTALLVSFIVQPRTGPVISDFVDPVPGIEADVAAGNWASAWKKLNAVADNPAFNCGPRVVSLVWKLWQADPRGAELAEIAEKLWQRPVKPEQQLGLTYLLLQTGHGQLAARLAPAGAFANQGSLESELALHRAGAGAVRFSTLMAEDRDGDARVAIDRAFAYGYLGDFGEAREQAGRAIGQTVAPGTEGSTGMIIIERGLCRRQIARIIQILSVWDAVDNESEPLMFEAARELMVDPKGLLAVAPHYFTILGDAIAYTGQKNHLLALYETAESHKFRLPDEHLENKALLAADPRLRPPVYRDIRSILSRSVAGDNRSWIPDLQEAAWAHDDERAFRVLAWYLWATHDQRGVQALLEKTRITRGSWHNFYEALGFDAEGADYQAHEAYQAARQGFLAVPAQLNMARLRFLDGQIEDAGALTDEVIQTLELRSLGLVHRPESAYSRLNNDALALRSRLYRAQGRETDAQNTLNRINDSDPRHPALYDASGIAVRPEPETEKVHDETQD